MTFLDLFKKQVLENGTIIAIRDDNSSLTYAELDKVTDNLAFELASRGFMKGDAGCVLVPRIKEIMVGAIAILKCGGIFVPMDSSYPQARLEFMLQNADAKILLGHKALLKNKALNFPQENTIDFDTIYALPQNEFTSPEIFPEDTAMILYTSGTTGNPKGVLHNHKHILNTDAHFIPEGKAAFQNQAHIGLMLGFTFAFTTISQFAALKNGSTLYVISDDVRKDMQLIYNFIQANQITQISMPSSMAVNMMEQFDLGDLTIFAGGEKVRNFTPLSKNAKLLNIYGSTETGATFTNLLHGDEEVITVGKCADNLETLLLDDEMNVVENGEPGNLLVCDEYMSSSYLNLPEKTAIAWRIINGKKWYWTGDRARQTEAGEFVILGRNDNMVKIHGYRVETGEVELQIFNAVNKFEFSVREIVVVVKNINGADHLCCFYEANEAIDTEKIQSEISKYLAEYMMPDIWQHLTAMPRNANGKVIRTQMPEPEFNYAKLNEKCTEAELRIVKTVCQILGVKDLVSLDEKFTALGGTSLSAMKVASSLRNQGIMATGPQILRLNVLRKIAEEVEINYDKFWNPEEFEKVKAYYKMQNASVKAVLPLSVKETDRLIKYIMQPDYHANRSIFSIILDSKIAERELQTVLNNIQAQHDSLCASIFVDRISVYQKVITDRPISIHQISYDEKLGDNFAAITNNVTHYPLNIQNGMIDIFYYHTQDNKTYFFVTIQKISFNTNQIRVIVKEILEGISKKYPADKELADWVDVLELGIELHKDKAADEDESNELDTFDSMLSKIQKNEIKKLAVYSDKPQKKIVFVHTGNTGSEAYYNLAQKIGDDYSFAVFEPYNLYHANDARYGIKNLAAKYVEFLKEYQPEGPYILGGWCYGGMVAHEMACQLQKAGEKVELLIMLDSHATTGQTLKDIAKNMHGTVNKDYFETAPLFAELREKGLLNAMIENAKHVSYDMMNHVPDYFDGRVLYFKPQQTPLAAKGKNLDYWQKMMEFDAGNYENYCNKDLLKIVQTPHEHDLMMDEESLKIIIPELNKTLS